MNDKPDPRDLVDLPGFFLFKIICYADQLKKEDIPTLVRSELSRELGNYELSQNESRQGKYNAYSINLHVEVFEEIERIYAMFRKHDAVVMVL